MVRGARFEVRGARCEVRGARFEVRGFEFAASLLVEEPLTIPEVRRQRTEDRRQIGVSRPEIGLHFYEILEEVRTYEKDEGYGWSQGYYPVQ